MKTLILTLLFLTSLPVLAKSDSPSGLFQVDSSRSLVTLSGDHRSISGFIDIKEDFPASSFRLETGDGLFESATVSGAPENFTVRGHLISDGETREVELQGTVFGVIQQEEGHERLVLKLSNDKCVGRVFAHRPKVTTTELYKTVQEIFR